jgi:PD-(D/E)XK nuclease superfamily
MEQNPIVPDLSTILPHTKQRQQIHVSGVNMANDCGQRYVFRYLLGIKRPPNAFLLVGKSTDESVTQDLDHKIETGVLLSRSDVLDISAAKFEAEQKAEPIELDADEKAEGKSLAQVLGEAKDKAVALSGLHHDEAAPIINAERTRRKFSINMDTFLRTRAKSLRQSAAEAPTKFTARVLDDQARALNSAARDGIDFVGEQDIVERIGDLLVVRDTKTSGKAPTPSLADGSKKPGIADESEQLTAYATASFVVDGKLPDKLILDYLVQTNAATPTRKYVPTVSVRDMDDVNVFLNRFTNLIHAMKTGVFIPANQSWWGCSEKWCGWAQICPYFKKPKLVQITAAIPTDEK